MLEFLVDSVSDSGHAHGRNGDQDIPVGTTFTALRRSRVHRESGAYRSEPSFQRYLQGRADAMRQRGEPVELWK